MVNEYLSSPVEAAFMEKVQQNQESYATDRGALFLLLQVWVMALIFLAGN